LIKHIWQQKILKFLLKNQVYEERTYFVLTLIVGLAAALVAYSLHGITGFFVKFLGTNHAFDLKAFIGGGLFILVSGYITTRLYPSSGGSGLPGVRVALAVFHGKITLVQTLAKYFTSILSLSSGFSLGREGPTATVAAGFGSYLAQLFHLPKRKMKALVASGVAGGIAAAFNTPIAAVVFTLEEVVGDLNAKILGNIIIAAVVASVTAHLLIGNNPTFQSLDFSLGHPSELLLFVVVGLTSGILGPFWTKSVLRMRKFNSNLFHGHQLTIIMLTFLIMAGISYLRPEVLGSGHNTIEEALLALLQDWNFLASLFILKFVATALCFASGISGGIFLPTLLIGATWGSLLGALSQLIFPELSIHLGSFALVGMGAYFVSVIRAPFTSIIMIFEMTRNYDIILPLMIANTVGYYISSQIQKGSIYEAISEQDGIHLPNREDNDVLESLIVEEAMSKEPFTLDGKKNVEECLELIKEVEFSGFPVLYNNHLVGMVSRSEINQAITKEKNKESLLSIAEKKVITVYPDHSLLVAFHKLERFHVSHLPVVSRLNNKRLIGLITAENIISRFGYKVSTRSK
jgi:chloride channel protein, CIC family